METNGKGNLNVSGDILVVNTKYGNAITPTPKYAAAIRGSISIELTDYDSARLTGDSWICTDAEGTARKDILDTACELFREQLSKKLDEFALAVEKEHPTYAFGNLYTEKTDQTPRLNIYAYGHNVGYCWASEEKLGVKITEPTLVRPGDADKYELGFFKNGSGLPEDLSAFSEAQLVTTCKIWVCTSATILAAQLAKNVLHMNDLAIDYTNVIESSPEFQYLVTTMAYWRVNTDAERDVVKKALAQYHIHPMLRTNNSIISRVNSDITELPMYNTPYFEKYLDNVEEVSYKFRVYKIERGYPSILAIERVIGSESGTQLIASLAFEKMSSKPEQPERYAALYITNSLNKIHIYTFNMETTLLYSDPGKEDSPYKVREPESISRTIFNQLCIELSHHFSLNRTVLESHLHRTEDCLVSICIGICQEFEDRYCTKPVTPM